MDDKRKHELWGSLLKYCQGKEITAECWKWSWKLLELIKKEGEEAAKKKKEVLAQRITPLPTLNGMSEYSWKMQINSIFNFCHIFFSDFWFMSRFTEQVMMSCAICVAKFMPNVIRSTRSATIWRPKWQSLTLRLKISRLKLWIFAEVSTSISMPLSILTGIRVNYQLIK